MKIDHDYFKTILGELVDENPLACHGVLSVSEIAFTEEVETLAVTLRDDPPRLLVNLEFVRAHCRTETHVKTLLLHEFLHVLLNHTGKYDVIDTATNLALDAVINHIIHRSCGAAYSEFFRVYYAGVGGFARLLVPGVSPNAVVGSSPLNDNRLLARLLLGLADGTVLADDILELIVLLGRSIPGLPNGNSFLGNHDPGMQAPGKEDKLSPVLVAALDETFRQLNGHGIFRAPRDFGCGSGPYTTGWEWRAAEEKMRRWEAGTWNLLRELLTPDPRSQNFATEILPTVLPVLNGADRRGFLRSLWNPIIPDIHWAFEREKPLGSVQVYLDVSGSMHAEIQAIVGLLNRFRNWVRMPFWAFSTEVVPAVIEKGILKTSTSGGTSMNCVLAHIAAAKPEKALVITDGYIESCDPALLRGIRGQNIHALVSRDGSTAELCRASIPCTQLAQYPDTVGNNSTNPTNQDDDTLF